MSTINFATVYSSIQPYNGKLQGFSRSNLFSLSIHKYIHGNIFFEYKNTFTESMSLSLSLLSKLSFNNPLNGSIGRHLNQDTRKQQQRHIYQSFRRCCYNYPNKSYDLEGGRVSDHNRITSSHVCVWAYMMTKACHVIYECDRL